VRTESGGDDRFRQPSNGAQRIAARKVQTLGQARLVRPSYWVNAIKSHHQARVDRILSSDG
jgi:hypothetical protein